MFRFEIPTRTSLFVAPLEDRCVPDASTTGSIANTLTPPLVTTQIVSQPTPAARYAVGTGAGSNGMVNIYDATTNNLISTVTPFGTSYTGGVRVAMADLNGDGISDLVAATATGPAHVVVIDGATSATLGDFTPFAAAKGGAFVATGDVNGDGRADLIVGSGAGTAPQVLVYAGQSFQPTTATTETATAVTASTLNTAYSKVALPQIVTNPTAINTFTPSNGDANFGVRVAAGDLNGDGKAEVFTASANSVLSNSLSLVNAKASPTRRGAILQTVVTSKSIQFPTKPDTAGMFVAVGDYSGTGRNDVAAGFVANGIARVRVVNGNDGRTMVMDAYSFNASPDGGVAIAMRDVNGDGKADVLAASGIGTSIVRVINGGMGGLITSFSAFDKSVQGGVYIG